MHFAGGSSRRVAEAALRVELSATRLSAGFGQGLLFDGREKKGQRPVDAVADQRKERLGLGKFPREASLGSAN
jgi:hypothetical protein